MILAVAATEIEMAPFLAGWSGAAGVCTLIGGVGPMETAVRLTRFVAEAGDRLELVVNFGIGGAYLGADTTSRLQLLDLCLAEQEVAGDFGICLGDRIAYLDHSLTGGNVYPADAKQLRRCRDLLDRLGIAYVPGVFVTVNAISGTAARGRQLQRQWNGLCENMEGAAVARVCREFSLPFLELRCISNYVEDRDPTAWRLREACHKAARATAQLLRGLTA